MRLPDEPRGRALRIAHYHTRLPEAGRKVGGVEIAVHRLANALVDLGQDEITVVSATPAPADARYRSERFMGNFPFLYRRLIPQYLLLAPALNLFDFSRFDLVHFHGDDWFYFRRRQPTVRTLYGSALREAQHASTFRNRALMYGIFGLEHLSTRLCRVPLALGTDTAKIYGVKNTVAIGVDARAFSPGKKHPTPRILFVGTWSGRKRGQFVYETFVREVLPRVPNAELCMVSDHCPPHPNVFLEHFPDDATLARRFREAWVFASASTYEGFGIPYVEALASGTVVVATPNPGSRDVLSSGGAGILVEDGGFGAAIARLLLDPQHRAEIEVKGLERSRVYAWEAVARDHRRLYLEALGHPE